MNSISESLSNYQNKLLKRWDQFIEEEDNKKKAKEAKEMKKNYCKYILKLLNNYDNIYIYIKRIMNKI